MKKKRKQNPTTLKDLIKDIRDDIETIKDVAVKRYYLEKLDGEVDRILEMDDERPLTKSEIKKIVEDLNKFDELIQLTFEHYQITGKWYHFRSLYDYGKILDSVELAKTIKRNAKKGKSKLFQEWRPKIPKLVMSDRALTSFITNVLESTTINDKWTPTPPASSTKGKK